MSYDLCRVSRLELTLGRNRARMCTKERKDYIKAVKCLTKSPAKTRYFADGARTRYDDFVAVHINQTLSIHATVRGKLTKESDDVSGLLILGFS